MIDSGVPGRVAMGRSKIGAQRKWEVGSKMEEEILKERRGKNGNEEEKVHKGLGIRKRRGTGMEELEEKWKTQEEKGKLRRE